MAMLKSEINQGGTIYVVELLPDSIIRKAIEYSEFWLFRKTRNKKYSDISILQWDYEKNEWKEISHKHG